MTGPVFQYPALHPGGACPDHGCAGEDETDQDGGDVAMADQHQRDEGLECEEDAGPQTS
ncbi:putative major facilitator superfamily permease [Streptomyces sp. Tu6071]|nr:putative major facilitator superfamily permease [Streptomyces sp. Tu6071]